MMMPDPAPAFFAPSAMPDRVAHALLAPGIPLRLPLRSRGPVPVAAILSDRPETLLRAARAAGLPADCANATTAWLLPFNAPRIVLLDLPVAGLGQRRLDLFLRRIAGAAGKAVIIAHNPHPALPCDIALPDLTAATLSNALCRARHLLSPPAPANSGPALFRRPSPRRVSLFG